MRVLRYQARASDEDEVEPLLIPAGLIGQFEAFAENVTLVDTNKVSLWTNLSSGGDLAQGGASAICPVWNATGWNGAQPCLEITDAANNYMSNNTGTIASMTSGTDKAWTLMFTFQNTSAIAAELYHGCWSNATQFVLFGHTVAAAFKCAGTGGTVASAGGTQNTSRHVIAITGAGAGTTSSIKVYLDGVEIATGSMTLNYAFTQHIFGALFRSVTEEGANTRYANWYLWESTLSLAQTEQVRAYIKGKWGGLP